MRLCISALIMLAIVDPAPASVLVVDSFDDGSFAFSNDQSATLSQQQFGSMLGGERVVTLSTDRRPTTVSASLVHGSSVLTFDTGTGNLGGLDEQGELILIYGGENRPYRPFASHPLNLDLSNFNAIDIHIPVVVGTGEVSVILYSGSGQSSSTPVTLQSPGMLQFSFSPFSGGLADVDGVRLDFVGLSPDFAVSIDDIRIVPEPTVSVLISTALLVVAGAPVRRRNCCNQGGMPR